MRAIIPALIVLLSGISFQGAGAVDLCSPAVPVCVAPAGSPSTVYTISKVSDISLGPNYYVGTLSTVTVHIEEVEVTLLAFQDHPAADPCFSFYTLGECHPNPLVPPTPITYTWVTGANSRALGDLWPSTYIAVDANQDGTPEFSRTLPVPYFVPNT